MKRLVLHLAIIAVLFAVIGQGTAISEEFIVNGDFESGLDGWSNGNSDGTGEWSLNDIDPISGNYDALANGDPQDPDNPTHQWFLGQTITLPSDISLATLSWSDSISLEGGFVSNYQEFRVRIGNAFGGWTVFSAEEPLQGPNIRTIDVTDLLVQQFEGQEIIFDFYVLAELYPMTIAVDNVSLYIETGPSVIEVDIDIKPGSYPNSINLGSNGNVPVAILGSADFDATTVDPYSVTLAGAEVLLKGKAQTPMASVEDVNEDGYDDLVVHVDTTALELSEDDTIAVLEGETDDGTLITGEDTVRIVP